MNKNGSIKARNLILIVVFAFLALNIIALPNKINLSYYNCSFLQNAEKQETQNINLKIFNFLSARSTKPVMTPEVKVIPGGQPIGVKIYTKGILVVGFSDIETPSGKKQSPSVIGGIEIGDRIEELNGNKVNTCRELIDFVNKNKGNPINIKVNKNDREKIIKVKPIETVKNDEYKIGLWVRDTTSGVGTMTFYDPESGTFGALGHPINDVDTGLMLTIRDGKIYTAKIMSVEQGTRGNPGELRGMFDEQDVVGNLQKNTSSGIFGKMTKKMESKIYDRRYIYN
jgi:stage IV sporulation protein B